MPTQRAKYRASGLVQSPFDSYFRHAALAGQIFIRFAVETLLERGLAFVVAAFRVSFKNACCNGHHVALHQWAVMRAMSHRAHARNRALLG